MRIINSNIIRDEVAKLCIKANTKPADGVKELILSASKDTDGNEREKWLLDRLLENIDIAEKNNVPICQDTGMAVIFCDIGEEVYIEGNINDALNMGVADGYVQGALRKSVVGHPINRINTNTNTPAVIYYDFVPGDKVTIHFMPKGFGSENKSAVKMLIPADGREGVEKFVLETVKHAGGSPCPPVILGVGIGGTMEKCALLSKKALLRSPGQHNEDPVFADMEIALLEKINELKIGVGGLGGKHTCLWVAIEGYATHIAGLPAAVTVSCNATRHASVII